MTGTKVSCTHLHLLVNPVQEGGDARVDPGLVHVSTADAKARCAHQLPHSPFLAHQRPPAVSLDGEERGTVGGVPGLSARIRPFSSQNSGQGWLHAHAPSLRELTLALPTMGSSAPQGRSPPAVSLPDSRGTEPMKAEAAGHSPGSALEGGSARPGLDPHSVGVALTVALEARCTRSHPPAAPGAPPQTLRTRAGAGGTLQTPPAASTQAEWERWVNSAGGQARECYLEQTSSPRPVNLLFSHPRAMLAVACPTGWVTVQSLPCRGGPQRPPRAPT